MMDESLVARYPDLERLHFWWATRRKFVMGIYRDFFGSESARVLDVGCGSGVLADMLAAEGAKVIGIDLEVPSITDSSAHLISGDYFVQGPSLGEFDMVTALDVVEHFEDDLEVLRGLVSNTRPGGRLLITVPAYQWLWSSHDDDNHHYHRYTRAQLSARLEHVGLVVERVGYLFCGLVVPKAVLSLFERFRSKAAPTGTGIGPLNKLAAIYFALETWVASRLRNFLPCGTSVVAVAKRPSK